MVSSRREEVTKVEHVFIPTAIGILESLLEWDPQASPKLVAMVCHPHPMYGGTMHNKVVFRTAKAIVDAGFPVLRFNFRGVGKSSGSFAEGIGERGDVNAALDYLDDRFHEIPVCLAGFSFGASVGLAVGANHPRVVSMIGLGLPVDLAGADFLHGVTKPKLFIHGTQDEFTPRPRMEALYQSLAEPKQIHWVENADHFFTGKLEEVQQVIRRFLVSPPQTNEG